MHGFNDHFPNITMMVISNWKKIFLKNGGGGWKLQKIIWKLILKFLQKRTFDPLVLFLWKLSNLWPWAFAQLGVWNAWCKRTWVFFHVYILRDTRTPDYNFCWKWRGKCVLKIFQRIKKPINQKADDSIRIFLGFDNSDSHERCQGYCGFGGCFLM